ncbi:MAG: hypothetical protein HKN12_05730, partial [Gemmatimonadetes bacterium]|nr:hypothetical protein [Gemmatimonadota bacterium]
MKLRALAFTSCAALLLAGCSDDLAGPAEPAGPSPAMAPISTLEVIDFESELHRKQLFNVYTNLGTGPIGVRGKSPFVGAPNAAVVYDSANPETWDLDLGTPSAACGGPGNGTQTGAGTPYENCRDLGKVLIVNDAVFDGDNDGLVNRADDFNQTAYDNVWLFFSFDQIGPQTVQSITALDIDGNAPNPRVELYDADTTLVASYSIPSDMPDNGSTIVDLGGTPNVSFVKVYLNGSGAIDELVLGESVPAPAQLGDLVWCDENENGIQDGTEPGLAGVTIDLTCTAADGTVTNLSTVTDATGSYLFTDLPPGACTVTVDASTAPDGCDNIGDCPVTMDVDLD